jgi:hypothetical protein
LALEDLIRDEATKVIVPESLGDVREFHGYWVMGVSSEEAACTLCEADFDVSISL